MNILLDETKLQVLLLKKRDYIGRRYDILGILFPVATYFISLFCSDFHDVLFLKKSTIQTLLYILAVIYFVELLYRIVENFRKKYNYKMLYEDIRNMNQIKHYFSLIAIKGEYQEFPNRFLLYYDQAWKCWFFPNCKTKEEEIEQFITKSYQMSCT